jgi:TolB protein
VSNADGTNAVVLRLPASLAAAVHPHWSPDGTEIAFAAVTSTKPLHSQIDVMDADGTHVHRITRVSVGATDPTWSPDGKRIAFESLDGDIWVVNADGTGARPLRHTTAKELDPAWSPDGSRIAFSAVMAQSGGATTAPTGLNASSIFVMHADGRFPTQLTPAGVAVWPAWAPDGREIAFTCNSLTRSDLCVMNADGTDEYTLLAGPRLDMQPAWS